MGNEIEEVIVVRNKVSRTLYLPYGFFIFTLLISGICCNTMSDFDYDHGN